MLSFPIGNVDTEIFPLLKFSPPEGIIDLISQSILNHITFIQFCQRFQQLSPMDETYANEIEKSIYNGARLYAALPGPGESDVHVLRRD